jgi:hypothetical protein
MTISRRKFVASMLAVGAVAAGLILNIWRRTPRQPEQIATTQTASPQQEVTRTTQATSAPAARQITANDFSPEQTNIIETLVVLVNFSDRRGEKFDLGRYLDRIFGFEDPHTQLNAYYRENFYNQLELRQVRSPDFPEGYVEIEFEGSPQDYMFGWLIGMETEKIKQLDPDVVQQNILDAMAKVVQKHATIGYQDKFIIFVFNALGSEYGRGAAGALPTAGVDPIYDLFVGNAAQGDSQKFSDHTYFRIVDGTRVVGIVKGSGYTFGDYFRDRGYFNDDQFIKGIAIFAKDGPLSCASHDILHGLRRRSAYADPPEGRGRAVNCLYNLLLQSQWVVGSERGPFDRSINCSPFIGWWDPMGDHLHPRTDPKTPREFFSGHPHGMCAFTKLRMGMVPDRCIFVAEDDDMTVELSPLSSPSLPPKESEAEAIVVKVPVAPGVEKLAHVYLLLEYRRRVGSGPDDFHPDNFFIDPDYVEGDKTSDPGYNSSAPAESVYVNPPTRFVPDEGVLVYLVNEKMPEIAGDAKQEWWRFVLALLNPKGNEKRNDLNQAALDAGESMEVDFGNLYPDIGAPVKIRVTILQRSEDRCKLQITREYVG